MRHLMTFLFMGLALVGCSLKKTAESAAKTTKEMNETTKDLKENSEALEEKTHSLEAKMTFDRAYDNMKTHLDRLFLETAADLKGVARTAWDFFWALQNEPDLLLSAGATFHAMHFQYWEGTRGEGPDVLDLRMSMDTEFLLARLFKHVPRNGDIDVFWPGASFKGVGALGAQMHLVHDRYLNGLSRRNLPIRSFYDHVILALRERGSLRHSEFPRTTAKILLYEPEAIHMLQLRHNFLPVMVLCRMTDFQDRGDLRRLYMWMKGRMWSRGGNVASIDRVNLESLREWTHWLNMASQTRRDLVALGITPKYNTIMRELVAGIDFGQVEILAREAVSEEEKIRRDFAEAYVRVVNEYKPLRSARVVPEWPVEWPR